MKKNKSYFIILRKALMLSVVIFTLSCKKKDNTIGTELYDDKVNVNIIDNIILNTYTVKQDSLISDELSTSTLGSYLDPVLGEVKAGFYTQLRLSADNVNFAPTGTSADIALDSVVLALSINSYYGSLEAQTFEVYEVNQDIFLDSTYYNNKTFTNLGTDIVSTGAGTITPNPNQGLFVGGDSVAPQLRIKLDNTFGQKIINESGNSTISDNTNFLQFLKGIYVTVNTPGQLSGQGSILLLDLLSAESKVTLYFRDTVALDTNSFDLLINSSTARVNQNSHNYTGTAVQSQLTDSTFGDNEFYIQGLAGLKSEIEFSDLERLKDSNFIINKAVLTLPVNYTGGNYTPNDQLIVLRNEGEDLYLTPDQLTFGIGGLGGKWDSDLTQYQFNITRYINNVLNGTYANNKLSIEATSSLVTPNRVILYGDQSLVAKPKLSLTYTKY
jgi:hypothetical protein